MSFRYIGPGGRAGHRARGSDISASTLKTGLSFFCAGWKTIEGQGATKIHRSRMVFLSVAEKDLS